MGVDVAIARAGDVEIYFDTFGTEGDPAFLLVNGLGSQSINYRVEMCERLAACGYHVIRYDNRDVGLSTSFDHAAPDVGGVIAALRAGEPAHVPYLLSDMSADGLAVLDELGIEHAHVMGMSMGGMIVQTMAVEHPERLLTMTSLMSTTGDPDVGQPTPEARSVLLGAPSTSRDAYIGAQLAAARTWGSPDCFDEELVTARAVEAFDRHFNPAGTARQLMAVFASGSRTAALGGVSVPTLVLHGDADTLIDPSGGRRTADAIPGARFVLIEGMGHDYPPPFWDQILVLLISHASRPTG
jgi:pimeloyl-ACP methyl ester carboxylesterase